MIRAIIIEDEDLAAKRLQRLIGEVSSQIEILAKLETIAEAVSILRQSAQNIDLIFLDIHLSDGKSFDIFEQVEVQIPIIFTTAYEAYAIQAFKQTSVDYLLKPIQLDDLQRGIEKFERIFQNTETTKLDYAPLMELLKKDQLSPLKKRFMVQAGAKIRSVDIPNIALFYAESKATFLVTKNGKRYDVSYTLEKLEAILDHAQFFRVNRKCILHIETIKEVYPFSKSRLRVEVYPKPSFEVYIPLDRIRSFKEWFNL